MNGYSVKLPLVYDDVDGPYLMNKEIKEVIKQNFKMLLMTNPGERVMDPNFGVGLKKILFNNRDQYNDGEAFSVSDRINSQVSIYLPYIQINDISLSDSIEETNALFVSIDYSIPNINSDDTLNLIFNETN